jgi:hypothetical protein
MTHCVVSIKVNASACDVEKMGALPILYLFMSIETKSLELGVGLQIQC